MVFLIATVAAVFLGFGWVMQQRIAAQAAMTDLLSVRLLWHLMHRGVWWIGIGSMILGASLGGVALLFGSVALVEPLLSVNLLFAFVFSAIAARSAVRVAEVVGALLLSAALGVFIAVGNPHATTQPHTHVPGVLLLVAAIALVVLGLVGLARMQRLVVESPLLAAAAGVLFGMQDASTSASLGIMENHGAAALFLQPWPYLVVASAATGINLSQNAFRAARLDYSLPPLVALEPLIAIAVGVSLLGNEINTASVDLAVEGICLVAMIGGVMLIARSASLAHPFSHRHDPDNGD